MLSPLYSSETIAYRVKELADAINRDFADCKNLQVIVTMNGAFIFASDLIRKITVPLEVHFVGISSYSSSSCKTLELDDKSLPPSFSSNPVLIIEDVIDNGVTLNNLRSIISSRQVGEIKSVALLKRQGGTGEANYQGFTIPKGLFVVGYGMDIDGKYREMPELKSIEGSISSGGIC